MWQLLFLVLAVVAEDNPNIDGEASRKVLGSSVVTSVSVIMDTGNGSKVYTDAVGKPVSKPLVASDLASPINLLHPDRYEFYTFDDTGDLVKRLMTLEEIQDIIATGDGDGFNVDDFTSNGFMPEKRVNDVVNNVQNVLKEEIKTHKRPPIKPQLDTPDVSDSWSMILPAIFGNSGEAIKPEPPIVHVTADTIMIEPTVTPKPIAVSTTPQQISSTEKLQTAQTQISPITSSASTVSSTLDVEISSNANSTTEQSVKNTDTPIKVVEIKPVKNTFELTKENSRPIFHVTNKKSTKRPESIKVTTFRPVRSTTAGVSSTQWTTTRTTTTAREPESTSTTTTTTTRAPESTSTRATTRVPETTRTTTTTQVPETTSTTTTRRTTIAPVPITTSATTTSTSTARPLTESMLIVTKLAENNAQDEITTSPSTTSKLEDITTQPEEIQTEKTETTPRSELTTTNKLEIDASTLTPKEPIITTLKEEPITTTEYLSNTETQTTEAGTTIIPQRSTSVKTEEESTLKETESTSTIAAQEPTTTDKDSSYSDDDDMTSLLQILHSFHSQSSPFLTTENENNGETSTVLPETPSTLGGLSTFFIVSDNKSNNDSTTPSVTTTDAATTLSEVTSQKYDEIDDLSTLGTEYITRKINRVPVRSTTESQSPEKTTTFDNLDQFLLTSTNIYEINSQLSEKITTEQIDSIETSTTIKEEPTEKYYIKIKEPLTEETSLPPTTTTDASFIDTIEQLISQAVGTVEPPVENNIKTLNKIEEMMLNSTNKTMPELLTETATLASDLIDVNNNDNVTETSTTTTEIPTTEIDTISSDDFSLLNESVESLLSQVSSDEDSTTLEPISTPTTTVQAVETTTLEPLIETTTRKRQISSTTIKSDDDNSHIINITIIRNENRKNQTKPAKADLSLEMDYEEILKEIQKNSTLLALAINQTNINISTTTSLPVNQEEPETTTSSVETTATVNNNYSETTTEPVKITVAPPSTTTSTFSSSISDEKPSVVITITENNKNSNNNNSGPDPSTWTLVSTLSPHTVADTSDTTTISPIPAIIDSSASPVDLVPKPLQGFGLEDSTAQLDSDIYQFVQLCNELAFGFWKSVTTGISSARSVVVSPFAATSLLAMVFLGARGATSGEMNEILKLDDMVTFNPHLIFKNVSESIEANPESGVAASAIVRELYSDRSKGKLLNFYKDRVRQFYDGHVEEASFREIGDVIRRRTNLLVKKNTNGKISEFLKDSTIFPKPPLAGISASVFHTDCSHGSIEGRDGELYFVVLPSIRQRRLIPIPATVYRSGFLAGYEPSLDATAAAIGTKDQVISTIYIIPGQQGMAAPGDGLARLEKRLIESSFRKGAWSRLLRSLIPRPGLELQIPRFLHRSLINSTYSLKKMGLHELFDSHKADLKGLNGAAHELHLSEVLQVNEFATCGEGRVGETHHKEVYPATTERKSRLLLGDLEEPRDYQRAFHDPLHDPSYLSLPLPLRPRQARLPEAPRLRFDRPFLYIVRHNPSGLILHMGRFHPRLLP